MQLSRQVRHVANEIAVTGPLQLNNILTKLKIKAELKQQFTNNSHNGALFHQTDQSYIPITKGY